MSGMLSRLITKLALATFAAISRISATVRTAKQVRKDAQCLHNVIHTAPDAIMPVLELYFVQKCAINDIADRLGIALKKLRRHILQAARRFDEEHST
ncbi:DNA-directed RNA polymerase specialized sigma24 family protein [Sphingobium xenophagum]|uniref:DNA-directed RNA polymerase specialized sigma24 family protein n=1 Tax=Sphingobium xenophagum TaxID=121428 RepID=A0ABU1X5C0_SPHXE|nr:hypothetical protein [Sphingobium xenophagum]MDR7156770.1 DNA-directed RNA polymerase specialized sigma24 family protein [Sphingobium xenophagum]